MIAIEKFNLIRAAFCAGSVLVEEVSQDTGLSVTAVRKYISELEFMARLLPEKLMDKGYMLPRPLRKPNSNMRSDELRRMLPRLVDGYRGKAIWYGKLYQEYFYQVDKPLTYASFRVVCMVFFQEHDVCRYAHKRVREISETDEEMLESWRNSDDMPCWTRAAVIFGSYNGEQVRRLAKRLELAQTTVVSYLDIFNAAGAKGLEPTPWTQPPGIAARVSLKQANLIKLMHETPQLHGFNQVSWTYVLLETTYERVYGNKISRKHIRILLRRAGFYYKKSRILLTSPDKKYREKVDHIKGILADLAEDESFFSIDEFGPFSVKKRGGRSIGKINEPVLISPLRKSKGVVTMTAALELSTNQSTYFYSPKKNSSEMCRLIDQLAEQYAGQRKLYLCWDAVIWHRSKIVYRKIAQLRDRIEIEIAPLPDRAQFLNVIESVFIGLARAVLNNSDYPSVEACKVAIDRHFLERNLHFKENPKRAGDKIWGKEVVRPVFDESHHCKTTRHAAARTFI